MTRLATITSITLFLVFIVSLCSCVQLVDVFVTPDDRKDDGIDILHNPIELDIGMVLPLSGEYAAPFGASMERGFRLARDEINESQFSPVRINFLTEDDMSTIDGMVGAFQRLVDAGVPVIVGIAISTQAQQAFPIAQENQVVTFSSVSAAAGLSSIGDYIFRAALAADKLNPAGVKATYAQLGYERVAVIYDDADVFSTSSNNQLTAALEELGVEVVTARTFQTGDTDMSEQLTVILELNPDVLFISALPPEAVQIMVQGRELGIEAPYIIPDISLHEVELAGDAAEGAITFASWHSTIENPINQTFIESFRSSHGIEPDPWAALSYATLFILHRALVEAISIHSEVPNSMAIRDALASTKDFDTNLGRFSFDANGEAVYDPVVLTVTNGSLVPFGSSANEPSGNSNLPSEPVDDVE